MATFLRRGLATSAVARSSQLVKTPIQVHGVEGRYAAALYSAAHKQNKLDALDKDLQTVKEIYQSNKQFKEFVLDPTLKAKKKKAAIEAVLQKVQVSKEAQNFFGLLAENGRLNKLEAVVHSFESIMRAHRGELFVQVTTAEPLSKANESALNDALKQFVKGNQKLTLTRTVNPAILGGLIITIGDKYVDLSIASKIKKYKETLHAAV